MKAILCLLLALLPFPICMNETAPSVQTVSSSLSEGVYSWYVKRNREHKQPVLPPEFAFLDGVNAFYCDTRHPDDKVLYLTFDAGYENGNISAILDAMKEEDVKGSFFVLSHLVTENTALVRRMLDEGHLVCNHTARHRDLSKADRASFAGELADMERIYRDALGCEISRFYRPPEGRFSKENLEYAKELGYATVFWSFAYADWSNEAQPEPNAAIQKILSNTHPGAVILLHPTSETNARIMRELIRSWKALGYRFETVAELCRSDG